MKKVISILLVLVMALSLCACGENSKYVGTYDGGDGFYQVRDGFKIEFTRKIVLNSNGSGIYTGTSKSSIPSFLYGKASISEGDILFTYNLKWEISDGYLVINGTGKQYCKRDNMETIVEMIPGGIEATISQSYELKGNKLFLAGSNYASFTKVN